MSVQAPACETLYASHLIGYPLPNIDLLAKFLSSVTELALEMVSATVTESDSVINSFPSFSSPNERTLISRPALVRTLAEHIHANFLGSEVLKRDRGSGDIGKRGSGGGGGGGGDGGEVEERVYLGFEDERKGRCLEEMYKSCKTVFQGILPSAMWKVFSPILLAQAMTVTTSAEERAVIYGLETTMEDVDGHGLFSITQRNPEHKRARQWYLVVTPHSHVDVASLLALCREDERGETTHSIENSSFLPCNSYSRRDFLGFSDDVGKWRDGILTSVLNNGNVDGKGGNVKRQKSGYHFVFAEYPVDEELAEALTVAHDKGRLQMDGNFSFCLPDNISIIFIAQSVDGLAESLLNRMSVLYMHPSHNRPNHFPQSLLDIEEFSVAMKELIGFWNDKSPFSQVSNILANKHLQLWKVFSSQFSCDVGKIESRDEVKLLNALVYAFLWSFCQGEGDNGLEAEFKGLVSSKPKLFGCVSYSAEASLFVQDFDGSMWHSVSHSVSLANLLYRLVFNGNSVLFVGSSLSQLLMQQACAHLKKISGDEFEYGIVTDLRQTIRQLRKSKEVPEVHPCVGEDKKMVLVIDNVDTFKLSDVYLLRDILEGFVFRAAENYERMRICGLAVIAFASGSFFTEALATKKPFFDKFVTIDIERDLKMGDPECLLQKYHGDPLPKSSFNFIQLLSRGDAHIAKVALEMHKNIRGCPLMEEEYSPIRILKLHEREALSAVFAVADNADHSHMSLEAFIIKIYRYFYLPLYSQESRKYMKSLLLKLGIWNQDWEFLKKDQPINEYLKSLPQIHSEAVDQIDSSIQRIDTNSLIISVVGDTGVGKSSVINIVCKKRNLQLRKATVKNFEKVLASCADSAAVQISMSGWGSGWRRYLNEMLCIVKTRPNLIIFLILSTNVYNDRTLETVFSMLRTSTQIIGIPGWSRGDLRSCRLKDVDTEEGDVKEVMEWFINIHMEMRQLCQKANVFARPSVGVFNICLRLCNRQISVSKAALDGRIKILTKVFEQYQQFEEELGTLKTRLNSIEEKRRDVRGAVQATISERVVMHLEKETVSHARHQVQMQKADFEKQLSTLKMEGDATRVRIMQKFTTAKSHLEGVCSDDAALENFISDIVAYSRVLHLEPIATILTYLQEGSVTGSDGGSSSVTATRAAVSTSTMSPSSIEPGTTAGGTQPVASVTIGGGGGGGSTSLLRFCTLFKMEDWRAKLFEELDPWAASRVNMTFIRQMMKGFEFNADPKLSEISTASVQCLVDLCEGIIEINASSDEISEIDTKVSECELVLDKMMEEERQLSIKESALAHNIDATAARGNELNTNLEDLFGKANKVQVEIERAATISKLLEPHLAKWKKELEGCIQQKGSLVAKEALTAASKLYLLLLPLRLRDEAFEKVTEIVGFSDEAHCNVLRDVLLSPWNDGNMISTNSLPGWAESLVECICLVYDPNNLLPYLLKARLRPNYIALDFCGEESFDKIDKVFRSVATALKKGKSRRQGLQEDQNILQVQEVEDEDDVSDFVADAESDFDIVISHFSQPELADFVRDRLMPGLRVYLVTSTRRCPIPSGILYVNLFLNPDECRSILLTRKVVSLLPPPPPPTLTKPQLKPKCTHLETQGIADPDCSAVEGEIIAMALSLSISSTDVNRLQHLAARARNDGDRVAAKAGHEKPQTNSADAVMPKPEGKSCKEEKPLGSESEAAPAAGVKMAAAILGASQDMNSLLNRRYTSVSRFLDQFDAISAHNKNGMRPEIQLLKQMSLQYPVELLDLFKFLVGLHKFGIDNELEGAEVQDLFRVCGEMGENVEHGHKIWGNNPTWCKLHDWGALRQIAHPKNVNWVEQNMADEEQEDRWRRWYASETWEAPPEVKSFGGLLFSVALKMDNASKTFSHFLRINCPEVHSTPCDSIILEEQLLLSDKTSPICLLLRTTDDPSEEIQKLARHVGLTDSKLKYYALDGGGLSDSNERTTIDSLLHTAGVRGQWLVLQNIEQNKRALTCCSEYLNEANQNVHKDFRLWLTMEEKAPRGRDSVSCAEEEEGDDPIEDFLQRCIVIYSQDRRSLYIDGSEFSDNDPSELKGQFKFMLNMLNKSWGHQKVYNCLYWDKSTRLPHNRILSLFEKTFDVSLPNLKNVGVNSAVPEICSWLLHYIYLPYVYNQCDGDQISADILEITQTVGEFYGSTRIPPEELWVVSHLKTPQFVEVIHTKEQSRAFISLLGKLLGETPRGQISPVTTRVGGDTLRHSLLRILRICRGEKGGDPGEGENDDIFARLAAIELDVLSGTLERYSLRVSHVEHSLPQNLIDLLELKARALRSLSSPVDLSLFSNPSIPLGLVSFNAYRSSGEATFPTDGHEPSTAKLKETYKHGKSESSGETSLDAGALEPGTCYDILVELHEEQEEEKMAGRSSKRAATAPNGNYDTVSEGERQNELFSGILLFGGFWKSNSEGLRVDCSQTELQDLGTVRLSPVLRHQVSSLTHMRLPVFTARSGENINSFWVCVKRPLNDEADIEVKRNVKFIVKDYFQYH